MTPTNSDVSQFLADHSALIVEPSSAFINIIQLNLVQLGMKPEKIFCARTIPDAQIILSEFKPQIIITEYKIGDYFGLSLFEKMKQLSGQEDRISIIVTKDSSDNAVAEAAEAQLDAFIVKPFSASDFKRKFVQILNRKRSPSEYALKIKDGKSALIENDLDKALKLFKQAKFLNSKPVLACYYLGSCHLGLKDYDMARVYFSEARALNPLHYKCLVSEFESYMEENKYDQAYELVELILHHYPVTSARLGKFFIAAFYSSNFSELAKLYELFVSLDYRPPLLVKLVSLALMAAGKFFVRKKDMKQALIYFEKTCTSCARDITYIEKITDELLHCGEALEASKFLKYVKSEDHGSAVYAQLNFKVRYHTLDKPSVLELGRKVIFENKSSPEVLKLVVELAIKMNKFILAEELIAKGSEMHPQMRRDLYDLLETIGNS